MSLWRPNPFRRRPADPGDAIRRHYRRRLRRYRSNWAICHWAAGDTQKLRFSVLTSNVDLRSKRLLDVGCGLGDLWAFLGGKDSSVEYVGVDLLEEMVAEGRRRNPGANLICADIFASEGEELFPPQSFDVVFCSGALNLELGNNDTFVPRALVRMFELARETFVFNLLHRRVTPSGGAFHPFDPKEVLEILRPLPCDVRIIDDYLPNDFTVVCSRR
ncbi:MAG: class I SAM-dependent methyltransferase [Phycisphaerae bacterium]